MNEKDNKKSKLILGMIIAIIVLLLAGIIYQFICIKRLERQIDNLETSSHYEFVLEDKSFKI